MSNNKFSYTYSAPTEEEREEINIIRRQYLPQSDTEAKLSRLRRLDSRVNGIPQAISLCIGVRASSFRLRAILNSRMGFNCPGHCYYAYQPADYRSCISRILLSA